MSTYTCPACGQGFELLITLSQHVAAQHPKRDGQSTGNKDDKKDGKGKK